MPPLRPAPKALRSWTKAPVRACSSPASPPTSPFAPRHFLSIADLTPQELTSLVRNAHKHKQAIKSGSIPNNLLGALAGKTVAMTFNKRSTRTRVSTEAAVATMGGHPMFLGKEDIQLGVNESVMDTALIISSMTSAIVARVGPHSEVADLAKHSTVPVINALCNDYHPLQHLADLLTITETRTATSGPTLGLEGLKIAWVGDSNNVLYDMCIGAMKLGITMAVATPPAYSIPKHMKEIIQSQAATAPRPGTLTETTVPEEAIRDADIIVTDTWISMGQEAEAKERLRAFAGYQVTNELAQRAGAKEDWQFMHCLPRHQEEVNDEVFYGPRSVVFREGENRLWTMISALESFVVNKGKIV
ncbi:ornithine carbamoyltransferase [Mytilinidion resinicola]|uniref:Ornithine carbamoyltransferase, mitochondrial n=1 Tax=Mytilinidion resinicola TaxID=574789 RepID=A0A6A6YLB6_9PEZI|nr:ornithine carbamoyltransferase [Mytilinidion resinicola]KAF2809600.1 ornithine carbamoyltransferase [Mytilinidion resinicola]